MGYVAHELDLSDTQKSQIKTIWQGERPNVSELVREFASEQKEMDVLTFQEGADDEGKMQYISARQGATLAKSMDEVAAKATISKPTVYKYFSDKEQLFARRLLIFPTWNCGG
jgi:hypothetical protein